MLLCVGCEERPSVREERERMLEAEPPVETGNMNQMMGSSERVIPKLPTPQDQFMLAVRSGDRPRAERWLAEGAKLGPGDATLVAAVRGGGNAEFVEWLVGRGAPADEADPSGRTPLSWATSEAQLDTIRLLLAQGASSVTEDQLGRAPVHYAVFSGNPTVLELILEAGASVNAQDQLGSTPLMYACAKDLPELVDLLDEAGADWHVLDKLGRTAVERAHGTRACQSDDD